MRLPLTLAAAIAALDPFALAHLRVAAADCAGGPQVSGEAITLEPVASGLDRPVDVQAPPGDAGRLFIVEQRGRIRIVDLATDAVRPTPFLDIVDRVQCCGERGLLGLAFHPDFAANGHVYVNYTRSAGAVCTAAPPPGCTGERAAETVVSRFTVSPEDPDVADPASELILLAFCQPYSNHNGGQVRFGPLDGYLHVATGDGGDGGDPCNSGQRADTLLGKILRLDVDGDDFPEDPLRNYAIPETNPFADPADGVLDEIWALGLRNPWRFSFDRGGPEGEGRGDLYIADVGQGAWEEVDYRAAGEQGGENYEWRVREGAHSYSAGTAYGPGVRAGPIHEYPHGAGLFRGCSITGGVVYRGCRMPDLRGAYFFADYCNNWVGTFRVDGDRVADLRDRTAELAAGIAPVTLSSIVSFGEDALGEVYIASVGGRVHRVVPQPPPNGLPTARISTDPDPPQVLLEDGAGQVVLDGSASDDGDGGSQGLTYLWQKASGPEGDLIATPTEPLTGVQLVAPGTHVYRLTVDDGRDTASAEVTVTAIDPRRRFRRGESNGDGEVDLSDGVWTLLSLFAGGDELACRDASDANDSGVVDLSDAVYTFGYLFTGGPAPPPPGPALCGPDETEDELDCASYSGCPAP